MGGIHEQTSINQEDPHDEEVCNSNYGNFLLLPLHIFADLIIEKAIDPPSLDRIFYRFTLLWRSDDQGNNN